MHMVVNYVIIGSDDGLLTVRKMSHWRPSPDGHHMDEVTILETMVISLELFTLQWRHNECDGVSNRRRLHCLFNCGFRRWSKKTAKLRVTGLCAGNSSVTGEFPAQMASNAENVSIWLRHNVLCCFRDNFIDLDVYMQSLNFDETGHQVAYGMNHFWSKFRDAPSQWRHSHTTL